MPRDGFERLERLSVRETKSIAACGGALFECRKQIARGYENGSQGHNVSLS